MLFWCTAEWTANKTKSLKTTTVRTVGQGCGGMANFSFLHSQKKKKKKKKKKKHTVAQVYYAQYLATHESVCVSGGIPPLILNLGTILK
jgi:hypothetical protein